MNADQAFAGASAQRLIGGLLAHDKVVLVVAPGANDAVTKGVTTAPPHSLQPERSQFQVAAIDLERNQHIETRVHQPEPARHHSHNLPRLPVQLNRSPHHSRILAKLPLPILIAEHRHHASVWILVARVQPSPRHWRHSQRFQHAPAHQPAHHLFRMSQPCHIRIARSRSVTRS